jgi:hypothetical protein
MVKTTIHANYVNTFINNNVKGGTIFSVGVKGRDKRLVGRLVETNGLSFDVKPMNGVAGQEPERVFVDQVTVLKVKGEEVATFN